MIFESCWEPILIQRILISFEAILENQFLTFKYQFFEIYIFSQAADEAGLELNMELPGAAEQTIGQSTAASTEQVLNYRIASYKIKVQWVGNTSTMLFITTIFGT